jgi:hypothetical protein
LPENASPSFGSKKRRHGRKAAAPRICFFSLYATGQRSVNGRRS